MSNCEIYTLDDGFQYQLVDKLNYENNTYVLLVDIKNNKNICFRKIVKENNIEYFTKLEKNEFDEMMPKFIEKNKDLFK